MSSDKNRLIELLEDTLHEWECDVQTETLSQIADHLLANGVIVPPCKVGDTVYVLSQGQGLCMRWNVYEGKVVDIHLNRHNKLTIRVENGEKFFGYYEPCFIHKTKEEAEQALAERSGGNG